MNWIETENNKKINKFDIPVVSLSEIKHDIEETKYRPIGFFGNKENENTKLYIVLADDKNAKLYISSVLFEKGVNSYEALTKDFSQFHIFEREFYEQYGIEPIGHPWLKPLRQNQDMYPFFRMEGEDVHEVAVGPIHAGIIEPGHFRFMCEGEKVYNLEIMLGYQHRGIEELILNGINNRLAESISGDSVAAHNMAYSQVIESLTDTKISKLAELIRRIALEMERIAVHIGDLGAIAGDMAYLQGASVFGVTRTLIINTMLEISGNRFARGLIDAGGVNFGINYVISGKILNTLNEVEKTVDRTVKAMLNSSSCMSRMEKTGVLSKETAYSLGAVGMAARSSGIVLDSRFDFNDEFYIRNNNNVDFIPSGDVYSRFKLRYIEIKDSIQHIKRFLEQLNTCENILKTDVNKMEPNAFAISIVEGWRGEVVHIGITGNNSELIRYKIKDPSFNNWYCLAMAVRNNGISDFPLCNKSFNLSYCGNDL